MKYDHTYFTIRELFRITRIATLPRATLLMDRVMSSQWVKLPIQLPSETHCDRSIKLAGVHVPEDVPEEETGVPAPEEEIDVDNNTLNVRIRMEFYNYPYLNPKKRHIAPLAPITKLFT